MTIIDTIRNDWNNASFREKFGEGLFTEEQKRIQQYRDADIAQVNTQALTTLDRIDAEKKDEALGINGVTPNRSARSVDESFSPAAGNELRLLAPIRG